MNERVSDVCVCVVLRARSHSLKCFAYSVLLQYVISLTDWHYSHYSVIGAPMGHMKNKKVREQKQRIERSRGWNEHAVFHREASFSWQRLTDEVAATAATTTVTKESQQEEKEGKKGKRSDLKWFRFGQQCLTVVPLPLPQSVPPVWQQWPLDIGDDDWSPIDWKKWGGKYCILFPFLANRFVQSRFRTPPHQFCFPTNQTKQITLARGWLQWQQ